MAKVKHSISSRKRRKRILKYAKGYRGGRGGLYRTAKETVMRAKAYAYRGRKLKKRTFRALWIARISAACRSNGITYAQFIDGLHKAKVKLDRKILSDLAVSGKAAFKKLVEVAKELIKPKKSSKV